MSTEGIIAVKLFQETLNSDRYHFLRGTLIPEMQLFDGSSQIVLVLDNCSIHHISGAIDLLGEAGILVVFLPPYSPNLNPAEEFSAVKYYLMKIYRQ